MAAYGRPLHQPGTVPLRPLTLSDFFDAAFRTVRRNPKATIGMGALVTTAFLLLPFLLTVVLGATGGLGGGLYAADPGDASSFGSDVPALNGVVTSVFSGLAGVVVAGLIVPVVTRAALGRYLTIGESWQQARGSLLRLLGLTLLEALVIVVVVAVPVLAALGAGFGLGNVALAVVLGVLLGLVALVAVVTIHVKWFLLAAPALVAERRPVLDAVRRAGRLSGGNFWRILGTALLVSVVAGFAGQILAVPLTILGAVAGVAVPGALGTVILLLSGQLSSILTGAVVAPFTGTVAVLQYLDMRFRKEGFDLELISWTDQVAREGERPS